MTSAARFQLSSAESKSIVIVFVGGRSWARFGFSNLLYVLGLKMFDSRCALSPSIDNRFTRSDNSPEVILVVGRGDDGSELSLVSDATVGRLNM